MAVLPDPSNPTITIFNFFELYKDILESSSFEDDVKQPILY